MAIIIKELLIKGKVIRDAPNSKIDDTILQHYLQSLKKEIIEDCKEQIKEELERESMK